MPDEGELGGHLESRVEERIRRTERRTNRYAKGAIGELEGLVRRGLMGLAEAYRLYWPASGANDAAERNLTLHVGAALLQAGYSTYCEASFGTGRNSRLDLVAVRRDTMVLAESKRLYSGEGAERLTWDVERIRDFDAPTTLEPSATRLGVLLASTFNRRYEAWWTADSVPAPGLIAAPWTSLVRAVGADRTWGSVPLFEENGKAKYWGLYAIFPA